MITLPQQAPVVGSNPTTIVRFYSNVPWDDRYQHVRLYADAADLLAHLAQWETQVPSYMTDNLTPVRMGVSHVDIRVPFNDTRAYAINYVALKNTDGYNPQWVFYFVKDVQWLSKNTTRIMLEPDRWQNSIYDIELSPCFIERSHVPEIDDQVGAYLVPDNLETGEYISAAYQFWDLTPDKVILYASESPTGDTSGFNGHLYNNVYMSGKMYIYDATDTGVNDLNELLRQYVAEGKQDAVMSLFMAPQICTPDQVGIIHGVAIELPHDFEGYIPKNKKLFSYPYTYVYAENHEGNTAEYKFELSDNPYHAIMLDGRGTMLTTPQVVIMPKQYRKSPDNKFAYDESLVISAFPICAWASDTFRAYVAQNYSNIALNGVAQVVTIGAGLYLAAHGIMTPALTASLGIAGAGAAAATVAGGLMSASNGAAQVAGSMASMMDIARKPPTMHGSTATQNINAATRTLGFHFYTRTIKKEMAEAIDNYWTMYGYPIHRLQQPNITSRPAWNYIKTLDCPFRPKAGSVLPTDDLSVIRAIFDHGVTVWHTDQIGNYALANWIE